MKSKYQIDMLNFVSKYHSKYHSISMDAITKRTALLLERKGLIEISKWENASWQIKLK